MPSLYKISKITAYFLLSLLIVAYLGFIYFSQPKSDDDILKSFNNSLVNPVLTHDSFNGFKFRKIELQSDSLKPTIVFIHGTIGSLADFKTYLSDSTLQSKVNMIAYDRVGYNFKSKDTVQESIAFENKMLQYILKNKNFSNTIVVGYSFGGPIALSLKQPVKKVVLLAPALYSDYEVTPWMLSFYKSKLTRWLVPFVWKQASKEKISHPKDLLNFEDDWQNTPNSVISIHGKPDWIVPYANSLQLKKVFPKDKMSLITIDDVGHELVWTEFTLIKQQILNLLD